MPEANVKQDEEIAIETHLTRWGGFPDDVQFVKHYTRDCIGCKYEWPIYTMSPISWREAEKQ